MGPCLTAKKSPCWRNLSILPSGRWSNRGGVYKRALAAYKWVGYGPSGPGWSLGFPFLPRSHPPHQGVWGARGASASWPTNPQTPNTMPLGFRVQTLCPQFKLRTDERRNVSFNKWPFYANALRLALLRALMPRRQFEQPEQSRAPTLNLRRQL